MLRSTSRAWQGLVRPRPAATSVTAAPRTTTRQYAQNRPSRKQTGLVAATLRSQQKEIERQTRQTGKQVSAGGQSYNKEQIRRLTGRLLPGSFISMPLSKIPKAPGIFFAYQYSRLKAHLWDFLAVLGLRWQSKPTFTKKPRLQLYQSRALAAGKALHQRLGQALANGDRETLRAIATPALYDTLGATVARRSSWERISWEVLQNHGARLSLHRAAVLPHPFPKDMCIEQAVVAVDTTQKLERFDTRSGESVPGSARVQRRTEHLAITREWNSATFEAGPWLVLGNVQETTPEAWQQSERDMKMQEQETIDKQLKQTKTPAKS